MHTVELYTCKQTIHMKCQDVFSMKKKKQQQKLSSATVMIVALEVN